jgi:predicted transcriptional regulator of viral defense system
MNAAAKTASGTFRRNGGTLRTQEVIAAGIHPRTLYTMRDSGALEMVGRGTYRLASLPPMSDPDIAVVAKLVPSAVVCLISALSLHDLTTQIPHAVQVTRLLRFFAFRRKRMRLEWRSASWMASRRAFTARRNRWLTCSSSAIASGWKRPLRLCGPMQRGSGGGSILFWITRGSAVWSG